MTMAVVPKLMPRAPLKTTATVPTRHIGLGPADFRPNPALRDR
jgi:hypothetical protein